MEKTAPNVMVLPLQFFPPDVVVVVRTGLVVVVVATAGLVVVVVGALLVVVVASTDVGVVVGATEKVELVVALTDADGFGLLEQAASNTAPSVSATPAHVRRTGRH